ncbi:hypothetical protein STRTUCAR8_00311 [Streptomyces turgidiscabies Car8]|uniref:Uncharacterized protein n=1 Tax=Streptomyces turgidiscabies (strain Car8) TaxID=698760 RepID=L7F2W9_STRT8|nr:hypothetical protein STRTUCAR8_00311 [Streptomyces turgidiscabies Car8]
MSRSSSRNGSVRINTVNTSNVQVRQLLPMRSPVFVVTCHRSDDK